MAISQKIIARNEKFEVIEHNDHYHGRDHVSFLSIEYLPSGRFYTRNHRTLIAAKKKAGIA